MQRIFWLATLVMMVVLGFAKAEAQTADDKVDYIWLVDVSGSSNAYFAPVQPAIDTMFVEASKHDNLTVVNFAKYPVVGTADSLDADYYKYCDIELMLQALKDLVYQSPSKYVRAFVLSGFCNLTPESSDPIVPDSLALLKARIMKVCHEKDVEVSLLLLPPMLNPRGCSFHQVQDILPMDGMDTFTVVPDSTLEQFLLGKIQKMNDLRGISNEEEVGSSAKGWGMALGIAVGLLLVVGAYFASRYFKRRKQNETK